MCACMPNLRFLVLRTFPKLMGSSRSTTHVAGYGNELNDNPDIISRSSRTRDNHQDVGWAGISIQQTKEFEVGFSPSTHDRTESAVELVSIHPKSRV